MTETNNRGRVPAPHKAPDPWCCHVPPGADHADPASHCPQKPSVEISGPDGTGDYTHACPDHAGDMRRPGDLVYRLRDGKQVP